MCVAVFFLHKRAQKKSLIAIRVERSLPRVQKLDTGFSWLLQIEFHIRPT